MVELGWKVVGATSLCTGHRALQRKQPVRALRLGTLWFRRLFCLNISPSPMVGEDVWEEDDGSAVGAAVASAGVGAETRVTSAGCWVGDANAPSGAAGEEVTTARLGQRKHRSSSTVYSE